MTTLDSGILNIIGLIVAGSFLTGLLLWSRFHHLKEQSSQLLDELKKFQQTSNKSKKICEKYAFEVDWLKLTQLEPQSGIQFLNLWKRSCQEEQTCHGWLILNGTELEATNCSEPCPDVVSYLPERLNFMRIERSTQPDRFLGFSDAVNDFYLFRCNSGSPDSLVLVVSALPGFALEQNDIERLTELAGFVKIRGQHLPTPVVSLDENVEDLIAREMLEIRSLLDVEFQSPSEMMEGFLSKLAGLSGYEFASLYLSSSQCLDTESLSHFASGGTLQSGQVNEFWNECEQNFLQSTTPTFDEPLVITPESILEFDDTIPFRCGLLIPIRHEQQGLGVLFLTHSETTLPSREDAQLVEWASTFLIQTLNKEITRMEIMDEARRDALTHLANRRTFDLELERFVEIAKLAHEPLSLILLDVDHFKSVNDEFGHPTGDLVLQQVAKILAQTASELRVTDHAIAARYGGEEFAFILPNIGESGAVRIANQIREAIAHQDIDADGKPLSVTASFGVAAIKGNTLRPAELIQLADASLYQAKKTGRNRVCSANELAQETRFTSSQNPTH